MAKKVLAVEAGAEFLLDSLGTEALRCFAGFFRMRL